MKNYEQPTLRCVEIKLQAALAQSPGSLTIEFNGFEGEVLW